MKIEKPKLEHGSTEHKKIICEAIDLEADIQKVEKRLKELKDIHKALMEPVHDLNNYERWKQELWNHWMILGEEERVELTLNPAYSFKHFMNLYPEQAKKAHPDRFKDKETHKYS